MFVDAPRLQRGEKDCVGNPSNAATDDQDFVLGEGREHTRQEVEKTENGCCLAPAKPHSEQILCWEDGGAGDEAAYVDNGHLCLHEAVIIVA